MEDRNALAAHDAATALGLEQSLPPSSILRGLPAASQLFATHALGSFSFGSWGWLQLSGGLAALRLCTYPQYGGVRPSGVYLVEVLAKLERRQVPACAASPIQLAIRLGEAMDSSEKVRGAAGRGGSRVLGCAASAACVRVVRRVRAVLRLEAPLARAGEVAACRRHALA